MSKLQAVRGMNDILPDEAERWEAFETIVRDWLRAEGYGETFLDLDPEHGLAPSQRWWESPLQSFVDSTGRY